MYTRDINKIQKLISSQIIDCELRISLLDPGEERDVLFAEKEALEAEFNAQNALFRYEDLKERLSIIYQQYHEMGLNNNNYKKFLEDNYTSDFYDWVKYRDFVEPLINPGDVQKRMSELFYYAEIADKIWFEKLMIWDSKYTSFERKYSKNNNS